MTYRYTAADPEPHGTRELTRYHLADVPDTRRHYGRPVIRQVANGCAHCNQADRAQARLSRIRTAYRRRNR